MIPRTDLERIARAREGATGRVASFSFAFGPEQMATLRELAFYAARSPRAPVPRHLTQRREARTRAADFERAIKRD